MPVPTRGEKTRRFHIYAVTEKHPPHGVSLLRTLEGKRAAKREDYSINHCLVGG